jgi:hypothetical protein
MALTLRCRQRLVSRPTRNFLRARRCLVLRDPAMTGISQSGWLFIRGSQSVRLVREEKPGGSRLFVYERGTEVVTHDFADVTACMKRQAEIEQILLATGYQLAQRSSDRRSDEGIWHGPDHRRPAS